MAHLACISQQLSSIRDLVSGSEKQVFIDGYSLDVPSVIAVARQVHQPKLDSSDNKKNTIAAAVALVAKLSGGEQSQYGVTTGFGGSATTRTKQTALLQKSLLAHCQAGILPVITEGKTLTPEEHDLMFPQEWIRGVILVRLNSLIRAQSGTRWIVIDHLHKFLTHNIAPCVPLRQSVSASGDLGPLAYIASVLTGHEDIYAWHGEGADRKLYNSATVLKNVDMKPIELIAKEGLSLINGTGASAAVATIAVHECHIAAVASQVLTAFAVEVLKGFQEPFNPYLHEQTRPHPGQIEVAANIRRVLLSSNLARTHHVESDPEMKLRQDRYCLRASPQWLGPQLEDILSAQKTMEIELNSTTDNPIVDLDGDFLHHGANFMAMAVTSATEKMRLSVHHIAKLMFAQLTDLLNHTMNCGLPPNLAVGEPSVDYSLKGVDVAAAAYLSEIAYLSNPVSTHVNSAEMHNQSINSMALVSARYTLEVARLTKMLMSTHVFALCQAVDLRAMETSFRKVFFAAIEAEAIAHFPTVTIDAEFMRPLIDRTKILLNTSTDQDSLPRFEFVTSELTATLLRQPTFLAADIRLSAIDQWRVAIAKHGHSLFNEIRDNFVPGSADSGLSLLGRTRMLYAFVRETLGVNLHWGHPSRDSTTIGTEVAKIYHAWDTPAFSQLLVDILEGEVEPAPIPNGGVAKANGHGNGYANGNTNGSGNGYATGSGGGYVN
ncbi:hypothetical protein SERLA73DRAFT_169632 [Serpula lacrymans var. lacrymans S7.3]|uniref:Phenylalanine ammonia-lyase n=2 Tax=Serpula lacrymans var. lacrymans TaxID=341189 RepID=F8Q210_SERL3|nr:putative phenylalanin-ammonia lyase [Serpula lacrymans var. lacrymans S7.9]EGN97221.1 hypothetical protein SERLA73DRAFT_169632 [Serpula lacrymans var. lacrymans S7.3]EGO22829.1 putative phenylalanin-ammonia lyase [Serpula lacrymans var. lacrymans S7.9]